MSPFSKEDSLLEREWAPIRLVAISQVQKTCLNLHVWARPLVGLKRPSPFVLSQAQFSYPAASCFVVFMLVLLCVLIQLKSTLCHVKVIH